MLKKIILLKVFIFIVVISCSPQEIGKTNPNFIFKNTYFKDSKIYKMEIFDSKNKTFSFYFYNENNVEMINYGRINPLIAKIEINKKQVEEIYQFYFSQKISKNAECIKINNISYESEVIFDSNPKKSIDCIQNESDKEKFYELRGKINRIIKESPDYKRIFYWEFIER